MLGISTIRKLSGKFPQYTEVELALGLEELIKFLILSAYNPSSTFFPGNRFVDDLWHALILETASYRKLCDRIKPGCFVDHTGITFDEYLKEKSNEEVNAEQLSWLASYKHNFGPISSEVIQFLPLVSSMMEKTGASIVELNKLADSVLEVSLSENWQINSFDLQDFLDAEVRPISSEIDKDIYTLKTVLRKLASGISSRVRNSHRLPSTDELEKIFGSSTALAFTYWQHLAAIERLQSAPEWQNSNQELWASMVSGEKLCGLATTHLAKPGGAGLQGILNQQGYAVNGSAPWVCGRDIFDLLLVGFETEESIVFSLVDFPKSYSENIVIESQKMTCLNGTGTCRIRFDDFPIYHRQIVSIRKKDILPAPRKTAFIIPELGIGKEVLRQIDLLVGNSDHPRHLLVKNSLSELTSRLGLIERARERGLDLDELVPMRDEFNRDAIRLYSIALGAQALKIDSIVSRLQLEMFLFDSVIQTPSAMSRKISNIGKRYD